MYIFFFFSKKSCIKTPSIKANIYIDNAVSKNITAPTKYKIDKLPIYKNLRLSFFLVSWLINIDPSSPKFDASAISRLPEYPKIKNKLKNSDIVANVLIDLTIFSALLNNIDVASNATNITIKLFTFSITKTLVKKR